MFGHVNYFVHNIEFVAVKEEAFDSVFYVHLVVFIYGFYGIYLHLKKL